MDKKITKIFAARSIFFLALVSLLLLGFTFGRYAEGKVKDQVEDPGFPTRWPHDTSDLNPDPAIVFKKMPNGFRYVLMENKKPKDRVSMHLIVQAGSIHESDDQRGLAHFLEHMLFNGSKNFKPGELVKYFQSIGMQFGPDANAHTGFKETVYDLLLPVGSKKSLEKALVVMKDYAEGALLLESEVERERRVVLAEKRTRDSTSYRTYVSTLTFEFPEAKLSKRLPIGDEDILRNATRKQVKDFYDSWYRPEKLILVMIGDFDAKIAASLINDEFFSLSTRGSQVFEPDIGEIHHKGVKPFYHFEKEAGGTTISIETVKKVARESDSLAFQKALLAERIANRIIQNRLSELVSKADTPFTSASIGSGIFLDEIKYAEINAKSNPENWERSLELVEQALRRGLKYGFTSSELERVKKDFLSELDNEVKESTTRDSSNLARQIIWLLNADRVIMSPEQKKELFVPLINALSLGEVHEAIKKAWEPDGRLIMVTGNAEVISGDKTPEQKILTIYNRSKRVEVTKPIDDRPVTFPYLPEPLKDGVIVRKTKITDIGTIQIDYQNGVRLNLKKTDFKANEVLVNLSIGPGKFSEPPDKPGLGVLSTSIINESGLGSLTRDEIKRAMAGKSTSVVFSVGEDRFYFKGKTVTQEATLLFQLLHAYLVDTGYREDAYTTTMDRFRQRYQKLSSSIEGAMTLYGRRFLAGEDSRFGLPKYEKFKKLTLDDVRLWFNRSWQNDIEVSVVGDFDVDSIEKLAAKYLGNLSFKEGEHLKRKSKLIQFPINQIKEIAVETEIPKGLVVLAYPTEDLWNISRTRRFSILADIFSERLREKIREKLGSAYSTYAFNQASRTYEGYGIFQIIIHIDPQETEMIVREVKKMISDLIENGVTQEELERAIAPTLTSIKDMMRKNNYWLNTVLTGSKKFPQQIDWSRTIMKDYASITKEDVLLLAKTYLDNERAATIIVKPKS